MKPRVRTMAGAVAASLGAAGLLLSASGAVAGGSAALGSDMPSWSPDGRMLAFAGFRKGRAGDIFTVDPFGARERRLTQSRSHDDMPRWSPDGRRIVFVRTVGLVRQLVVMNADGSGQRQLTHDSEPSFAPSWSPDGRRIVFARGRDDEEADDGISADGAGTAPTRSDYQRSDIYVLDVVVGGDATRLTFDPGIDTTPAWSPDGETIVFTSDRGAVRAQQLYVMRPDGSGQRKLTDDPVSYHNERRPAWSPDGSTIAFVTEGRHPPLGNSDIYLVDADGSDVRRFTFFEGHDDWPAWSADGQLAISRGATAFRPEVFVMSGAGGLGGRKVTGNYLTFAGLMMSPREPQASRPVAVELRVRPTIDGFTDCECRARLGDQVLVDPLVTRGGGRLRCVWELPDYASGRMLRGVILASRGGSEVVRTFAMRVR
jgi:Tol biopolymer transport system component